MIRCFTVKKFYYEITLEVLWVKAASGRNMVLIIHLEGDAASSLLTEVITVYYLSKV